MKMPVGVFAVAALGGCVSLPPVQLRSAPTPTAAQIAQTREAQTRVIAVPIAAVFPKAIETLFDNGYVVSAADGPLGFIAFSQQWTDPTQSGANISEQGSLLFSAAGPQATQVRVMLTGGWQRLEATGGGPRFTDYGMVGGVQQVAGMDEYKKLLDLMETGLTSSRP
jgi:hypothetical protein